MLAKILFTISIAIPDFLINLIANIFGYAIRVFSRKTDTVAEGWVRGVLMAPRVGSSKIFVGRNVVFSGWRNIKIGKRVTIHSGSQIIAGTHGSVAIGDFSHVSRNSVLAGSGHLTIGNHCKISSGVMIYTVSYDRSTAKLLRNSPAKFAPVTIGDDVHIGANATILPGVKIGNNATIGAGAVVSRNVEAGVTVIGVPAKPFP